MSEELRNKINHKIIIYNNFTCKRFDEGIELKLNNALYIVECKFIEPTGTMKNSYFSHQVLDKNKKLIEDNTMLINGILIKVYSRENWGTFTGSGSFQGMALKFEIIDKLGTKEERSYDNRIHTNAYVKLIRYLEELDKYGTHFATERIITLEKKLLRLTK
jgi:hypothetical protein